MARGQPALITQAEIRAAVAALEGDRAAGRLTERETARRINDCRRAVTPRDLWKASGGRAGSRRRSDWADIRRTVFGLGSLLIMIALGVWLVTWVVGLEQYP
jgi:hypothetical protein